MLFILIGLTFYNLGYQSQLHQIQLQTNPVHQYLHKNYGVDSIDQLIQKYKLETYEKIKSSIADLPIDIQNQYLSRYQDIIEPIETKRYIEASMKYNLISTLPILVVTVLALIYSILHDRVHGKKKEILLVVILLLITALISHQVGVAQASTGTIHIGSEAFVKPASYIIQGIDTDGDGVADIIKAINGTTGQVDYSGTDAATVIQYAIDALLGKWGTVLLKGSFELSRGITLWCGIGLRGMKAGWDDTTHNLGICDTLYGDFNEPIITVKRHPDYSTIGVFPYIAELGIIGGGDATKTNNHGIYISKENGAVDDIFLRKVQIGFVGGDGIHIDNDGKHYITDFYAEGCKGHGIYIKGFRVTLINGYIYNNNKCGIKIDTGGAGEIIVAFNRIGGSGEYGLDDYPSHKPGSLYVIGNEFCNNGGTSDYSSIRFWDVENALIIGNVFYDSRDPIVTRYHLEVHDSRTKVTVIGNIFKDSAKYGAVANPDGATLYMNKNIGYVTENSGSIVFSNINTVTFEHGLAGTPTLVLCSFNNTDYGSWTWTANSTHITITVTTANYNGTCYWYAEYKPGS